ncbi:hypothetical protein [Pseudodesulfovibrio methanolicus]|uniref:Uncharacterized protein n=1 Tax=Pseudodesulfovibrio methanolicus TaxID=3126690 RepID=A0ABZ2J3E2_9BACT
MDAQGRLFEAYSEAFIYRCLQQAFNISHIPESDKKTPDFKIILDGEAIFIENKSLRFLGGDYSYKNYMNDSLTSLIEIEDELKDNDFVIKEGPHITPLKGTRNDYDPFSPKYISEIIIDKTNQNLKKEQFELGTTFLLVDLSSQIPLLSKLEDEINRYYYHLNSKASGILFTVAYGEYNQNMYRPVEFEGASNKDGTLHKEGILTDPDNAYIAGIIFHYAPLGKDSKFRVLLNNKANHVPRTLSNFIEQLHNLTYP